MLKEIDDSGLWALIKDGSEQALLVLRDRYYHKLVGTAFFMTRDSVVARDIVTDIFLELWMNRSKREVENLFGYLKRCVHYQGLRYIQELSKEKALFTPATELHEAAHFETPEFQLQVRDLIRVLNQKIEELPKRCAEVLRYRLEGMSNQEIAELMNISKTTVEKLFSKAKSELVVFLQTQNELVFTFFIIYQVFFLL